MSLLAMRNERFFFSSSRTSETWWVLAGALVAWGCAASDPEPMSPGGATTEVGTSASDTRGDGTDGSTDGTGGGSEACAASSPDLAELDESGCSTRATAFVPGSMNDPWDACISDDGTYHLVGDAPGSIGRVMSYETIASHLWKKEGALDPSDFTAARVAYAEEQGLESRVQRREDMAYPPIPMADWDPGFDGDKQCSALANQKKYPDRCAGPTKIAPLVNAAFAAGEKGEGEPRVHAARIHAGLLWFLKLSVRKEAESCARGLPEDCDSSWAYYTGGAQRDTGLLGLSFEVEALSAKSHTAVFDAVLAARCARDLFEEAKYPTWEDLPADGQKSFEAAWAEIDHALARAVALLVRDHLARHGMLKGADAAANWAFIQVLGATLDKEAATRDATNGAKLAALWKVSCPTTAQLEEAAERLGVLFPCG